MSKRAAADGPHEPCQRQRVSEACGSSMGLGGEASVRADISAGVRVDMSAEQALAAAEAEALPLVRSATNASGFKHVRHCTSNSRPYHLEFEGKHHGCFATPEEAALHYSRHVGKETAMAEVADKAAAEAAAKEEKEAKQAAKAQKAAAKAAEAAAREAARQAAKEAKARQKAEAAAAFEELKRQQAAHQELMARRQQAMLQQAAERQRQQRAATAGGSQPGAAQAPQPPPHAAPAAASSSSSSAEPGELIAETAEALVAQVLRDRGMAHLCLGVDFAAPREVVRKRYLALVLRLHPDKVQHPQAGEAFAAVEAAFRAMNG